MYTLGSLSVRHRAVAALVTVSISFVFLTIAIRLLGTGFGPITQVYMRLMGGSILSVIVLNKSVRWNRILKNSVKDYLVLLLMGTVGYSIAVYFITLGALHASLLNVSVILAMQPFFVAMYTFFVFKEKIKPQLLLFLILSVLGVAIVATKSLIPQLAHFGIGELYLLIAAACWGWYAIGRRLLSKKLNNSEITVIVLLIAFLSSLLFAVIEKEPLTLSSFGNWQVLLGLLIGSGLNLIATQLENFSFANLELVFATQILLLENFFAPILGFLLYREVVSLPQLIGALLIIAGVYGANKLVN